MVAFGARVRGITPLSSLIFNCAEGSESGGMGSGRSMGIRVETEIRTENMGLCPLERDVIRGLKLKAACMCGLNRVFLPVSMHSQATLYVYVTFIFFCKLC